MNDDTGDYEVAIQVLIDLAKVFSHSRHTFHVIEKASSFCVVILHSRRIVKELLLVISKNPRTELLQLGIIYGSNRFLHKGEHVFRLLRSGANKIAHLHTVLRHRLPDSQDSELLKPVPFCDLSFYLDDFAGFYFVQRRKFRIRNVPFLRCNFSGVVRKKKIQVLFLVRSQLHRYALNHKKILYLVIGGQ